MKAERLKRTGFTLLEVLVAMTILVIIVLIVSGIFQQSRIAWEAGLRKTDLNTEGRAALNLMAQELGAAVMDGPNGLLGASGLLTRGIKNGNDIDFFTVGAASNGARVVKYVRYTQNGALLLNRQCKALAPNSSYPTAPGSEAPVALAENLKAPGLLFTTSDGQIHMTNLPLWVDIELTLGRDASYSVVTVKSLGPDASDAADDIKSTDLRL